MHPQTQQPLGQSWFYWCFLGLLAVLPISNTIALRNLLLLVLVCLVILNISVWRNRLTVSLRSSLAYTPWILTLWIAFLFVFPMWALQSDVAWQNLRGQWIESVLAWLIGFGAVLVLGRRGPTLWILALASAVPIAIHLLLSVAAWGNLLGANFDTDPSLAAVWKTLRFQLSSGQAITWKWQAFPMGFRGIEPMHGNIGYTACQTIALSSVCFCMAWRDRSHKMLLGSVLLIGMSFLSILIAYSRGAALFGVVVLTLATITYVVQCRQNPSRAVDEARSVRSLAAGVISLIVFSVLAVVAYQAVKSDSRWHSMLDKVELGLLSEAPQQILCNGLSTEMEKHIRAHFANRDAAYVQELIDGLKGQDGGRILLMREGMDLVLENPRGLDGSRQSFEKLMVKKCGHQPTLQFAHAHQAWMNLALALGWLGVILFAGVMGFFLMFGWKNTTKTHGWPWAMALFLIAAFWTLRGFADAVYQEHYLQMQALLLAYLYWRFKLDSIQMD